HLLRPTSQAWNVSKLIVSTPWLLGEPPNMRLWAIALLFVSSFLSAQTKFSYRFHPLPAVGGSATDGDFDRDRLPDIAVSSSLRLGAFVSVLFGGYFTGRRDYPVSEAGAPATADVNNAGWFDIAVAQYAAEAVLLLMNNGDGTFHAGNVIPVGNHAFD